MNTDKKTAFDRYIENEILAYEAELRTNPNRRTYSEEEVSAEMKQLIANWEKERVLKKCIS